VGCSSEAIGIGQIPVRLGMQGIAVGNTLSGFPVKEKRQTHPACDWRYDGVANVDWW